MKIFTTILINDTIIITIIIIIITIIILMAQYSVAVIGSGVKDEGRETWGRLQLPLPPEQ